MSRRLRDWPPPLGFLLAYARHGFVMAGYWIRPYDGLLDRRRWRWSRRGRCQFGAGREAVLRQWSEERRP